MMPISQIIRRATVIDRGARATARCREARITGGGLSPGRSSCTVSLVICAFIQDVNRWHLSEGVQPPQRQHCSGGVASRLAKARAAGGVGHLRHGLLSIWRQMRAHHYF